MRRLQPEQPAGPRIPIVTALPAPSSSAAPAPAPTDPLDPIASDPAPGQAVALAALDDAMFPTIWCGDLVVVDLAVAQPNPKDIVVAVHPVDSPTYLIRGLGRIANERVQLCCDSTLGPPPHYVPLDQVQFRGLVTRIIRLPSSTPPVDEEFAEFCRTDLGKELLATLTRLPAAFQAAMLAHAKVLLEIERSRE